MLTYLDRIRGCLIGGAIGDALGAGIEFDSLAEIRRQFGPVGVTGYVPAYGRLGAITDDTQMTVFTVEGLIRAQVRGETKGIVHVPSVVWPAYQRWLSTQEQPPLTQSFGPESSWLLEQPELWHRRAPGNTCLAGLRRTSPSQPLPPACAGSKGCGTVMRAAPFGLVGRDPEWTARTAIECSELTHGHPTAGHASAALALIVAGLLRGLSVPQAVAGAIEHLSTQLSGADETVEALAAAVAAAAEGAPTPEVIEKLGAGWVAEEALAIAVYCALATPDVPATPDVRTAMLAAVNHSGDSDSTGAICGNILGAALGLKVFPADWAGGVEAHDLLIRLADDVHHQFAGESGIPGGPGHDDVWYARYPGY